MAEVATLDGYVVVFRQHENTKTHHRKAEVSECTKNFIEEWLRTWEPPPHDTTGKVGACPFSPQGDCFGSTEQRDRFKIAMPDSIPADKPSPSRLLSQETASSFTQPTYPPAQSPRIVCLCSTFRSYNIHSNDLKSLLQMTAAGRMPSIHRRRRH